MNPYRFDCKKHGVDYRLLCDECVKKHEEMNKAATQAIVKNEDPKNVDSFLRNKGRNPNCPKCHGEGSYMYDELHGTICDLCCPHDRGWWKLKEYYGNHNGKWCCMGGCGKTKEKLDAGDREVEV